MRYTITIIFVFVCCSWNILIAQNLSFKTPYKLDNAINSQQEESQFFIFKDDSIIVFTRNEDQEGDVSKVLYFSTKNKQGKWHPAIEFAQTSPKIKQELQIVGISDSGRYYMLENPSTKKSSLCTQFCNNNFCTYHLEKIELAKQKGEIHNIYIHPSDSVMLLSITSDKDSGYGQEDLYVCLKDKTGKWSEVINLGITINSESSEITPFLSQDKMRLFFSSNRQGGLGGFDIFYSDRLYDSWVIWTVPRNLDSQINTSSDEKFFYLHQNAAYFISNKGGSDDIYKSQEMEYQPFLETNNGK